ncbi:MAG: hypothetical protein EpisKO_17580 [Epibacterium sp.]
MSESKIRNMEELASVSGISRPTLSKYFNNPDSVRASTRKKVRGRTARAPLSAQHLRNESEQEADQEHWHRGAVSCGSFLC